MLIDGQELDALIAASRDRSRGVNEDVRSSHTPRSGSSSSGALRLQAAIRIAYRFFDPYQNVSRAGLRAATRRLAAAAGAFPGTLWPADLTDGP
jgi:hypothetical protein